jgi:hypothetical protein
MLYELHLNVPVDAFLTPAILLDALSGSGSAWESVETHEVDSLSLICTSPDYGLELVLLDNLLSLSVPATHTGQPAREVFDLIWHVVRCLHTVLPVPLSDPQLGTTITPDSPFDTEKVLLSYAGVVRHLQSFEF